jgi:hypothetical protein
VRNFALPARQYILPRDPEPRKLAAEFLPLDLNVRDFGPARAMAAPGDEVIDIFSFSLGDEFDGTVVTVPHPTPDSQPMRLGLRGGAKEDSLDSSFHAYTSANIVLDFCFHVRQTFTT